MKQTNTKASKKAYMKMYIHHYEGQLLMNIFLAVICDQRSKTVELWWDIVMLIHVQISIQFFSVSAEYSIISTAVDTHSKLDVITQSQHVLFHDKKLNKNLKEGKENKEIWVFGYIMLKSISVRFQFCYSSDQFKDVRAQNFPRTDFFLNFDYRQKMIRLY